MKISSLQYDVRWMDIPYNMDIITNFLNDVNGDLDLLVLPEMFLTGFNMDATSASIAEDHPAILELIDLAANHKVGIMGSLAICEKNQYYNRVLLITEKGIADRYDKQFRFTPSGESEQFSVKYPTTIFDYKGWKVLPQVCYDLRFPENVRSIEVPDLLIYMANWPDRRIHHWEALLKARAIENQCYVLGCNRIGIDDNGWKFPGHSQMITFHGDVHKIEDDTRALHVKVDYTALKMYRDKYPFWKDKK